MAVIAVIFDFDDTLMPDSTSALLNAHGVDARDVWMRQVPELVKRGYDPPLAYLKLLLDNAGADRPLGDLTNAALRRFGSTLGDKFFPGIPEIFDDLRAVPTAGEVRDVSVEFYVISGGLREIILGSTVVQSYFNGVYGSELGEDPHTGVVRDVMRCITFTEKTRYLFEINKGIDSKDSRTQPHLVNEDIVQEERRVPFDRMVYVGDGLTDIPCFSLLQSMGGTAFGVFDPTHESSAKRAFQEFLRPKRVLGVHAPRYRDADELGAFLRQAVATVTSRIDLERKMAKQLGR